MPHTRARLAALVSSIEPFDEVEVADRARVLAWIASGAPIHRTRKPDVPPEHLVVYCATVDPDASAILLVDHRDAGLWLPSGGHVEPGEHPLDAARRELDEELGLRTEPLDAGPPGADADVPLFVSRTRTVGAGGGHVDVSLWYAMHATTDTRLAPDLGEFRAVRWWPFVEVHAADPSTLDPCLPRFVAKLEDRLVD